MNFTSHVKSINKVENNQCISKAKTVEFRYKPNTKISCNDMNKEINTHIQALKTTNKKFIMSYSMSIDSKYDGIARSSPITEKTQSVDVFDRTQNYYDNYYNDISESSPLKNHESKCIDGFRIFVTVLPSGGQASDDLLCFPNCLSYYHNNAFGKARFLYKYLNIKYKDPVTLKHAILLQSKCHYNLHVKGDECYEPENVIASWPHYYLTLINGHWSVDKSAKTTTKYSAYKLKERPICIFFECGDKYTCYDETGEHITETLDKEHNNINIKYVAKMRDENGHMIRRTLADAFDVCQRDYKQMKDETKGKLNPFCFNGSVHMNKFFIVNKINTLGLQMDNIEQYEHEIISRCRGAYSFCVPGEYEKVHSYDVKKHFASILNNPTFKIPFRKGTLATITQEQIDMTQSKKSTFKYGIYHVKVASGGGFRFAYNQESMYPSDDLQIAIRLGLKISVIEGEETNNALLYGCVGDDKTVIPSTKIFGDYIDELYEVSDKNKSNKFVKSLMASLYGVFIQMNIKEYIIDEDDEYINVSDGDVYHAMYQKDKNTQDVLTYNVNSIYKYAIARMKPFIYARQRLEMFNMVLEKNIDNIVYCRTDGVYGKTQLDFPIKDKVSAGEIGFEYRYKNVVIKNMNNINKELAE